MKFAPFDLFRNDYDQSYFQRHLLRQGVAKHKLVSGKVTSTPRSPFSARSISSKAELSKVDAGEVHTALSTHVADVIGARSPAEIFQASQNIARFNAAQSHLKPLRHPALLRPHPGIEALTQLSYELRTSEQVSAAQRDAHSKDVETWHALGSEISVAAFDRRMRAVLATDIPRIERKYQHLAFVAKAAVLAAHAAAALAGGQTAGSRTYTPDEVLALRHLQRDIKRSIAVAVADLDSIHGMYGRAQSAMMQFGQLEGETRKTSIKYPMRMDNIFGPGQVVAKNKETAQQLKSVLRAFFEEVGGLERPTLNHHISDLQRAQEAVGRALRGAQGRDALAAAFADLRVTKP